jgi:hypothetical protein
MMLECLQAKRLQRIFPVLFGTRVSQLTFAKPGLISTPLSTTVTSAVAGSGCGDFKIGNFFAEAHVDRLPAIEPTATLQRAQELLLKNEVTVQKTLVAVEAAAVAGSDSNNATGVVHSVITETDHHPAGSATTGSGGRLVGGAVNTVQSIVRRLIGFLALQTWEVRTAEGEQVVEECAVKVVDILRSCDLTVYEQKKRAVNSNSVDIDTKSNAVTATTGSTTVHATVPVVPLPTLSSPSSSCVASVRALKSLSVEEVGDLMVRIEMKGLKNVLMSHEVSGIILSACEEVGDLMSSDIGVTSKLQARALFREIENWKMNGVTL